MKVDMKVIDFLAACAALVSTVILLAYVIRPAEPQGDAQIVRLDTKSLIISPSIIDFGTVIEGEFTIRFALLNETEHVVKVESAFVSCNCAKVHIPNGTLRPGESLDGDVFWSVAGGQGLMQQRFRIECSTVSEDRTSHSDQPMLSAFGAVSAIVQPLWRVEPSVIDLTGHVSNLKADHASSVKLPVKVIPADGANISIVGADIVRGNFKPRISVETHIVFIEFELQDIPLASSAELQVATDCKVRPFMSVKIVFP